MSKQELKQLIKEAYENCETSSHFKQLVFELIDKYDIGKSIVINIDTLVKTDKIDASEISNKLVDVLNGLNDEKTYTLQ